MYSPAAFREDRIEILHAAIAAARLATLVTVGPEGPEATHLPLLLDPDPAPFGALSGHLARANPQARIDPKGMPALVIFQGPDAYVTPSWYASKREHGRVVPTWNYVAVHCRGRLETFDDEDRLRDIVTRLTARHEESRAEPWAVSDAPAAFVDANLRAIIGIRLVIERIEGKWKLSQNRPDADREGVAAGLAASDDPADRAVAAAMAARA